MHYKTDSHINKIMISDELVMEMDVGNGWSVTDVWWDHDIPTSQVDCIKVKFEKVDKEEATKMMKRALNSMEAKIREAYNKGYCDGYSNGIDYCKEKIIEKINEDK